MEIGFTQSQIEHELKKQKELLQELEKFDKELRRVSLSCCFDIWFQNTVVISQIIFKYKFHSRKKKKLSQMQWFMITRRQIFGAIFGHNHLREQGIWRGKFRDLL